MLTEQEYLNIVSYYLKLYPNHHFLQNTNYYLDRIRTINDVKAELTLKIKGNNGDEEINDDISYKEMQVLLKERVFPNGNVKRYLLTLSYPLTSYENIATLYNRRLEIKHDHHLLVIDKNEYSNIIDYNLEIEAESDINQAKKVLSDYINKFALSLTNQKYRGKATRAIDAATNH